MCVHVCTHTFKGATERRELDKDLRSEPSRKELLSVKQKAYRLELQSNQALWLQDQGTTDSPGLTGEYQLY